MEHTQGLAFFGTVFLGVIGALIVVPYMRRKADLLNGWNLLLLSAAMFIGVGSLEDAYGEWHWPQLQWFEPSVRIQNRFIFGAMLFFSCLFFFYYVSKIPQRLVANRLKHWPPITDTLLFFVLMVCGAIAVGGVYVRGVPVVTPILINLSHKAVVFATVFAFVFWYRNKLQMPMLLLFIGVFVAAALYAMVVFTGRRLLLSVVVGPVMCMYWLQWRYRRPVANMAFVLVALCAILLASAFYSSFRHFNLHQRLDRSRTVATVTRAAKEVTLYSITRQLTNNTLHYLAQYAGHYSLLTLQLLDEERLEVRPLNTLAFLASYPIPRRYWSGKPEPPGRLLLVELNLPYRANWGLGIVGEGYHDGGPLVLILYAFLAVVGIRMIDDPLRRQPDNLFLIATYAAAFPHLLGWVRGGVAIMTIEIVECVLFAVLLGVAGRLLFGTARQSAAPSYHQYALNQSYPPQAPGQMHPYAG